MRIVAHPFHDAKVRRIAEFNVVGRHVIGVPSDEAFIAAGRPFMPVRFEDRRDRAVCE
mgnify:CR=1 FL=1